MIGKNVSHKSYTVIGILLNIFTIFIILLAQVQTPIVTYTAMNKYDKAVGKCRYNYVAYNAKLHVHIPVNQNTRSCK